MPDDKFKTANHIKNFSCLRAVLLKYLSGQLSETDTNRIGLHEAISKSCAENKFFTKNSIHSALSSIAEILEENKLVEWISGYRNFDSC